MEDKQLRRAGLDYHELATVRVHADWTACRTVLGERRIFAASTRGAVAYAEVAYRPGDAFVFGAETAGLPEDFLAGIAPDRRLRLPMRPGNRSLNLSNAVAVVIYEAWRQQGYDGSV